MVILLSELECRRRLRGEKEIRKRIAPGRNRPPGNKKWERWEARGKELGGGGEGRWRDEPNRPL